MIPTPHSSAKITPSKRDAKAKRSNGGPVVDTNVMERIKVSSVDDSAVNWSASFATFGGNHAEQSSTIVYEIAPGGHLGWHTDATEETQYIIGGTGELRMEDGKFPVGPGSVFVLPTNVRHDLVNTGAEPLRAVAFFAAGMFTQDFDNVMLPPTSHILGTPNREG
ncbi:MAG: cupin domain-containing protein [Hyphomicrobium sp.]